MRKISILFLFAFFLSLFNPIIVLAEEKDPTNNITIQEALDIAYKSNPDLRKAQLEIEKAQILRDDAAKAVTWIPTGGLINPAYQQVFNGYQQAEIGLSTAKKAEASEKNRITKEVIGSYTKVLKDYNTMESMKITLEDLEHQKRIAGMSKGLGLMADIDYEKLDAGIKNAEEGYKAIQAAYEGSLASLRYLLGQNPNWNPVLTSRAILETYPRNELSVELSRGTSESILVWTSKALLDIEKSQEYWVLPNVSTDMRNINRDKAEINYKQAKRDTRALIEQLYHGINAIEGQIQAAEVAYNTAQKDMEIAQVKYDVGMIPRYSAMPGAETLSSAKVEAEKTRLELENLKADLAKMKADFAFLTGQTVYNPKDWI